MLKVSAIMPTRGRQEYAQKAVASFLSQTWRDKELIVLDDADDPSFPRGLAEPEIEYRRLPWRLSVGAKRNRCCAEASSDVIVHWDSDDWSVPERIGIQVRHMFRCWKQVVGFRSITFYDVDSQSAAIYDAERQQQTTDYALGSSLMYCRNFWQAHPFQDRSGGEDNQFLMNALEAKQLGTMHGSTLLVARVHRGNTSNKDFNSYRRVDTAALPADFFS